jgi:ribonuclease VapC
MFVDASALTSMIVGEDDASALVARVQRAKTRMTSVLAVWESATATSRIIGMTIGEARDEVHDFLELLSIEVRGVPSETLRIALDAFDRYGKGRHPARLNFGDCFSYACARHFGQPLLFKGGDFALTDIEAA